MVLRFRGPGQLKGARYKPSLIAAHASKVHLSVATGQARRLEEDCCMDPHSLGVLAAFFQALLDVLEKSK
jgi:hypothetical protein